MTAPRPLLVSIGLLALSLGSTPPQVLAQSQPKSIAFTYIVDHPAIDAARRGIVDGLAEAGFTDGKTARFEVQSAQGSLPTQLQIAKKFAGQSPDLIVAISTPSAQASQSATSTVPIVFSAVTDPVGAKLVESLERPGRNLTGTSDKQPFGPTLDLVRRITPAAKRIGVIYNAGEANSVAQVEALRQEATKAGFAIAEATAAQSAMVGDAARSLAGRADVILVPTDSTVVSAIEAVVRVGVQAKLPVFASDTASVERGAVAALGFDYYKLGKLTARIAARVLKGESPARIPVGVLDSQDLYLNAASAERMGVTLSPEIIDSAAKVIR